MAIKDSSDCKNQLNILQSQVDKINKQLKVLKQDRLINKYLELNEELKDLNFKISQLQYNYRYTECNHPLWYLEWAEYDPDEKKTYWGCTCVACEVRKEAHREEFENVVTGFNEIMDCGQNKYSFDEVKQAFNELYSTGKLQDTLAGKILIKKFEIKR